MQFKAFTLAALASTVASQSLLQVLNSTSDLSSLTSTLSAYPNLAANLSNATDITILAPNNAAFSAFLNSSGTTPDSAMIQGILSYHVIEGVYQNFTNTTQFLRTSLMPPAYTNVTEGQVVAARRSGNMTRLTSGLKNMSNVTQTLNFTGGVIHVIDRVLTVPLNISQTAIDFNLTSAAGALNATDLTTTVDTTANLTVFVPNNAAFQSIGSALSNLTTMNLTSILEYHVVPNIYYSTNLTNTTVATLQGNNVNITVVNSTAIYVNNARVVIADVLVANGVVHVIDEVLNPFNMSSSENEPAYSGASSVSTVPFTSGIPTPTSSINTADVAATATGSSSSGAAFKVGPTGMAQAMIVGGLIAML